MNIRISSRTGGAQRSHCCAEGERGGDEAALRAKHPGCIVMSAKREGDVARLREAIVAFFPKARSCASNWARPAQSALAARPLQSWLKPAFLFPGPLSDRRHRHRHAVRRRALELEQGAQRIHVHPVDVLDLVALVFGPNSDLPDVKADADAVERVGSGLARRGSRGAGFGTPGQHADLAVEIDRTERKDQ